MRRSDIGCSSRVRCKINTDGLWVTGEIRDNRDIDEPKGRWTLHGDDGASYEVHDKFNEMFSEEEWLETRQCGACKAVDVETWQVNSLFLVGRLCGACSVKHAGVLEGMLLEGEGEE